jgi:prepilin-type N-terminal cleavage/methylation domain-containing protein
MNHSKLAARRAGFTLVEIAIAATIVGLILGAVGMFQSTSQKSSNSMIAHADVERRGDRALKEVMDALRDAGVHTLTPDPTTAFGTNTILFRSPTAVAANGDVTFSAPTRIELRLDDGELDNGIDDNDDGVIDERALVITRGIGTAQQRAVTVCHGIAELAEGETANGLDDNGNGLVDESGFCVRRVGDLFFLYITLDSRTRQGERIQYSTSTALALRN